MDERIERTMAALERQGFSTLFVSSREEALKKVLGMIPPDAEVGIGGSVTVREVGLVEALINRGNSVAQHWQKGLSPEERSSILRQELNSDWFVTSSNAVTEEGELVNTDATGNRVAAMIFGPGKVLVLAGSNKIVRDTAEAVRRIKVVAAPLNARRLERRTPCASTGRCSEEKCQPSERICNVTTIMSRKPVGADITVVLVGEELGY